MPHPLLLPALLLSTWFGSHAPPPGRGQDGEAPAAEARADLAGTVRAALADAPRRTRLGPVRGVRFRSTVRFPGQPERPHDLEVSLAFPARTRMVLTSDGSSRERYQLGEHYFFRDAVLGTPLAALGSQVVLGAARTELQLDLALRRALFLWPDGAPSGKAFVGEGRTRTTKVGDVGVLVVTLDRGMMRPERIVGFGRDGRAFAEFRDIVWREDEASERQWPASFELHSGGSLLWRESVEEVDSSWNFSEAWFLPVDSIVVPLGTEISQRVRVRAIGAAAVRRIDVEAGLSLSSALDEAVASWIEAGKAPGATIRPDLNVVLSPDGEPIAIELEAPLDAVEGQPGWTRRVGTNVWIFQVGSVGEATGEAREVLWRTARETPEGAPTLIGETRVRCRVVEDGGGARPADLRLVAPARVAPVPEEPRDPASGR